MLGVIDSRKAGRSVQEVLGFGGTIPIFADLKSSLPLGPNTLLIGIAPTGGMLPEAWRSIIIDAIASKLEVMSGLHTRLRDDEEIDGLAKRNGVRLIELRGIPPEYEVVAKGHWKKRHARTILTVGSDCNVGKMTASLELHREFCRRGLKSDFVATGQTGILLSGKGVAVDSVISDYVAGAIELAVDKSAASGSEFIHVEGQGSLTHQGYSAVTLGLMHGVMPDAMIMVHHPARIADDYGFRIDDVKRLIELHEIILEPFKRSKVVGIAVNTVGMNAHEIAAAKGRLEDQTGLPAGDVLTDGASGLADALERYFEREVVREDIRL
ncbi:MAG: hypothetical protein AUI33_13145 [Ignavibacteria bacterium 13_1_40CM_2_61_4]|nr:MAG: hypothetical protein AUI33_13145 [Ignavibacteria bacterium 13_1_40CM_2_61_4]